MAFRIEKIALLLCLISIQHPVFSGTMGSEVIEYGRSGFYVGGTIGISDLQDYTAHEVNPETHHLGGLGILGGGIIGYHFLFSSSMNIGIEGFANATGLNTSIQHYDQTTGIQDNSENMHSNYNVGIRVLPGFQFTPVNEGHFIIGYSNAHFKNTDNGTYGYLDANFNKNGIQGGLGWKTSVISPNIFLRLDGIYTYYAGQRSIGLGLTESGSALQYYTDRFNTLEADLSLLYQF